MPTVEITGGLTLAYVERGPSSGSAVVLLPGPTDSWRSYEPVVGSIPDELRVVAVSLRGHAGSSKPPTGYRIEDLAADVVPLLDALHVERTVLVGHSGSCMVARRVALDRPDRVAGLFLEASPTTLRGHDGLSRFVDTVVARLTDPIDSVFARSFVTDTSTGTLAAELVERLVEDVLEVPVAAWTEMFASLLAYDDTGELSKLTAPAHLVWGDADELVPVEMQHRLLELLAGSALTTYSGVGHTPRWEEPERFATDLADFATRVLEPSSP